MCETKNIMRVQIEDTLELVERLHDFYEPEDLIKWFKSPQPLHDDKTPIEMILERKAQQLHHTLDNLENGTYI